MDITVARYTESGEEIEAIIDGERMLVPCDWGNRHFIAIMEWDGVIEEYSHPEPSLEPSDYPLLPWQFKAMIIYLDMDQDIRDAISQIESPMQRAASMSRYLNASFYDYNDPLMQSVRQAVGISEQDLKEAWMLAKDLRSNES